MISRNTRIGCLPLLVIVFIAMTIYHRLFEASDDVTTKSSLSSLPAQVPTPAQPKLDYRRPIVTSDYAIVCPQAVFLDRHADHGYEAIMSAFTSVFHRSEKVRGLGCDELQEGVPVYGAHRMSKPYDDFIAFSLQKNGLTNFFTMESHLEN
jgi:hypothetical protein